MLPRAWKKVGKVAIPWTSRGPVLAPLNFIIWGNVKTRILAQFERKIQKAAEICYRVHGKKWGKLQFHGHLEAPF
jgi:hypothetical protein